MLLFRVILPNITERAIPTRGIKALGLVLTSPLNAPLPYAMKFLGVPPCPIPPSPPGLPFVPVRVPVPLTLNLGFLVTIKFLALKFTCFVCFVTRRNLWVCSPCTPALLNPANVANIMERTGMPTLIFNALAL